MGAPNTRSTRQPTYGPTMGKKSLIEKVLERDRKPWDEPRGGMLQEFISELVRIPPAIRIHPWFRADLTDMRWLPINADVELPDSAPAPLELLDRLIEEASHRVIFNACGCRTAFQCRFHPADIGCLLMGDSALESPEHLRREVSVDEAKEHARRAVEAGLVPQVGKARVDNYIFGIKDRSRLLTACFCCDCCCITRYEKHFPARHLDQMFPRLDGIKVEVNGECDGCRECVGRCYIQAIHVRDGRAVIDDRCRACGRCAAHCPAHAIKVRIEESRFLEMSYERIRAHVKHD
jgi:UDP-glucose 4-epimerase